MRASAGKENKLDPKKYFEKYYSRLRFEAVLKSLLPGLIVGLAAAFVMATVSWFCDFNGLWLSIGLLVLVSAGMTVLFYYKHFKPTAESNARRIDRYGLEERLITMVELDGDDSYIAIAQREDAKAELAKFEANQIRFKLSKKVIIACSIVAVFGLGMTTVTGLSAAGVIPNGMEVLDAIIPDPPPVYLAVEYVEGNGGFILGDKSQDVLLGSDSELVFAFANDGYVFKCWSDGNKSPARIDENVSTELEFEAIFIPVDDIKADEEEDPEEADDVPEPEGGEGDGEGDPADGDPSTGGGKYDDFNQIIDGKTYYREHLDEYREAIEEYLKENSDGLTEEQKELIQNYIGIV